MPKKLSKSLYYLIILCIFILTIVLFRLIKIFDICCTLVDIVSPIFFGFILAWLLNPIYKKLNQKIDNRFSFALLIVALIFLYTLIIGIFVPMIIREGSNLLTILKDFIPKIQKIPYLSNIDKYLTIDANFLLKYCNNILSIVLNFALAHMFGFYILYNYNTIKMHIKKNIPSKYRDIILKFTKKLSTNMYLYTKGTLLDMLILFIISAILFSIFKLKYAILLALFCAITNIIPFIGPYIGGIPAVIVGLSSSLKLGIITLVVIVLAQTAESNVINPLIMSKCIKINPLLIIIAITVMGKFMGIIGMVFAVPTLIILKIVLEFVKKYKLIKNQSLRV